MKSLLKDVENNLDNFPDNNLNLSLAMLINYR